MACYNNMDGPDRKRLRLVIENDERPLDEIIAQFFGTWDVFKYFVLTLSLEELNRMCNINVEFRERCYNDPQIQAHKLRLTLERKAVTWKTDEKFGGNPSFSDQTEIFQVQVADSNNNGFNITVDAWEYRNDMYGGYMVVMDYYFPNLDASDFNVYKRLYNVFKRYGLWVDLGEERLELRIHVDFRDTVFIPLVDMLRTVADALINEGFYKIINEFIPEHLRSCVYCGEEAQYSCSKTNKLYCSETCYKNYK